MNEKSEHTDLFGNQINVGDYIVYSAADGQSSTLRVGQVLELKMAEQKGWDHKTMTSKKIDVAKVLCKSWSNFRSEGYSFGEPVECNGRQKNVTLGFLTRVLVVHPDSVSDKIKKDLDGPVCDYMGRPLKSGK